MYVYEVEKKENRQDVHQVNQSIFFSIINYFNYVLYTVSFCLDTFDFESEIHDLGK